MARNGDNARQRILDAAYRCFYKQGFYRTSVDEVAATAKVTKKTLYYHFVSKDALMGAVLEDQQDRSLGIISAALDNGEPDAGAAIRAVFRSFARWASGPDWHGTGFARIAMELADLPGHPARVAARRHKRAVEAAVAVVLRNRGVSDPERLYARSYCSWRAPMHWRLSMETPAMQRKQE